jgi:hypothetical protein
MELTLLYTLSLVQYTYLVTSLDGTQSMGNDDGGTSLHGIFESRLYFLLAVFVKS